MSKKVLITGGAGFIGSAIIKNLQNFDYEIFVIDNLSFGNRSFINIQDENFFKVDIRDAESVDSILKLVSPNWIIHLAAIHFIPYCNENPFEASDVNIRGTINVLNSAKKLNSLEKIFFASTAAVYPICDEPVSEDNKLEPLDIYGLSKLTGEHLFNEFFLLTSIPTLICRFFNAFGPNETNPHLIPEIQNQINSGCKKIKLGNLEPKRDFIHTQDMAIAVMLLLEKKNNGVNIYNLGRGEEYSVKEVVDAFSKEIGREIVIEVDANRIRKVERMHLVANIDKLKSTINWSPKMSLEQGIKTLIKEIN